MNRVNLKVHHVNKRSVMMCLKNKDNVNRMEETWVKQRIRNI